MAPTKWTILRPAAGRNDLPTAITLPTHCLALLHHPGTHLRSEQANSERVILNKTFTILDPPHLDRLDLDPPALAACARLDIGAALPPAVVAHAVPRGCQLPRLEKDNIRSLSLGYTILQSCFVKKSTLSIVKFLEGDSQLVNHRLCLV